MSCSDNGRPEVFQSVAEQLAALGNQVFHALDPAVIQMQGDERKQSSYIAEVAGSIVVFSNSFAIQLDQNNTDEPDPRDDCMSFQILAMARHAKQELYDAVNCRGGRALHEKVIVIANSIMVLCDSIVEQLTSTPSREGGE